jgi:hypothetical protein
MKFKIDLRACYIAMWMWLHKHPDKKKDDWPGFFTLKRLYYYEKNLIIENIELWNELIGARCFACIEARLRQTKDYNDNGNIQYHCFYCPCKWGDVPPHIQKDYCLRPNTLFQQWASLNDRREILDSEELKIASKLAKQIAELWKERKSDD